MMQGLLWRYKEFDPALQLAPDHWAAIFDSIKGFGLREAFAGRSSISPGFLHYRVTARNGH